MSCSTTANTGITISILCLGYKANVIKDYFLNYKQTANSDFIISDFGRRSDILGGRPPDWRITLVDTGTWRNIGERLVAVRTSRRA